MKARIGSRTTTLTLSDGERLALLDVLAIARATLEDRATRAQAAHDDPLRIAIHTGGASFTDRIMRALGSRHADTSERPLHGPGCIGDTIPHYRR